MKKHANLLNKGLFHYRKDELLEAKKVFEEVLKIDSDNVETLAFLGKINLEEQDFINAIKYLKKAGQISPDDTEIQNNLALAFEQLGQNIDTIRIDDEFRVLILDAMPQNYHHLYHAILYEYENENEIRKKIAQELNLQANSIWHKILKLNEDPELENIGSHDLEYLINFAFSDNSPIFKASEMPYFTQTLWKKVLKIDETNFLAASKIREYETRYKKQRMKDYVLLTEQLDSLEHKDLLEEEKNYLADTKYGKTIKNSFRNLSTHPFDINKIIEESKNDEGLIQFLKIYEQHNKDLPIKDAIWQVYKLGITEDDIFDYILHINILTDEELRSRRALINLAYRRAGRMEQTYLQTGNLFRLVKNLENLEKAYPTNMDIKFALSKFYLKRGKDLKAEEKMTEISRLISNYTPETIEKISKIRPLSKSKNDVYIFIHDLFEQILPPSVFVFKIGKNNKSLKKERDTINSLENLNRERDLELKLPRVLSCTKNGGNGCLAMEASVYSLPTAHHINLSVKDLLEELGHRQEGEKSLLLKKVVEEIAKIHAHIPENLLQQVHTADKEKNDKYYIRKIEQKLFGNLNKLVKYYNRSIESDIKAYNIENQQRIKSINRRSVEKEVKERLKQKIDWYEGMIKQIENDNFKVEQPVLFMPRFNGGYAAIAPRWEEYIQNCKENAKKESGYFRDTAMRFIKKAKKEFEEGMPFPLSFYSEINFGGESYKSFAEKELSKEDYKKSIKRAIKSEKKKITGSLEKCIKEEIKSQKNSIKEMNERWKLYYKKSDIKITSEQEYQFFKDYSVILDILSNLKPGVYKDASLKNFLMNKDGNVISIDFETLRNSPYQIDIASALESVKYEEPDIRKELLKHYCNTFNLQIRKHGNLGQLIENFDEFEKNYYACAIHKCLIHVGAYLGFFLKDKEHKDVYKEGCKDLFENASWNVNQLKNYSDKSSAENEKLDRLGISIKNLEENLNLFS